MGSQGWQKMHQDPLNTPFEVWCTKIAPKLKNTVFPRIVSALEKFPQHLLHKSKVNVETI